MKKWFYILILLLAVPQLRAQDDDFDPVLPPDPNAAYYVTGTAELVGADKAWSETAIAMTKNADNTFTHTFSELAEGVIYRMKITNGTWDKNWGFNAVANAPVGVMGDSDGNVVFKLATKGNVDVTFNGTNITLTGDFTDEKPINANSVPSECEDVMLQAFYYDSYRDGAPGDVLINGKQLGNTKWDVLLSQSGEIGTYFDLVWLPPSGKSEGGTGYHQTVYSNQNSDWGKQKDLLEFINRMHAANTKVVADIVINHAGGKSWCEFFPQNFGEYGSFEPDASWIAQSDEVNFNSDAGDCKGKATGPEDGGYNGQDNYPSARDWAHAKPEVQEMMKAYLKWMKNVIGFDGWRYDYAQGFKGKYIDMYNSASENYFSVVEFWNGDMNNIKNSFFITSESIDDMIKEGYEHAHKILSKAFANGYEDKEYVLARIKKVNSRAENPKLRLTTDVVITNVNKALSLFAKRKITY